MTLFDESREIQNRLGSVFPLYVYTAGLAGLKIKYKNIEAIMTNELMRNPLKEHTHLFVANDIGGRDRYCISTEDMKQWEVIK